MARIDFVVDRLGNATISRFASLTEDRADLKAQSGKPEALVDHFAIAFRDDDQLASRLLGLLVAFDSEEKVFNAKGGGLTSLERIASQIYEAGSNAGRQAGSKST